MKKNNITIILPLKEYDKKKIETFKSNLLIQDIDIITICKDKVPDFKCIQKDLSYEDAINAAVKEIKTDYFTIAGVDDIFSEKWFENLKNYSEENKSDVYMTLVMESDQDSNPLGYQNEIFWSMGFSENIGYMDHNSIMRMGRFSLYGCVFNRQEYINSGMLKNNLHCMSEYELMLRMTYQDKKIFIIPKIGYLHLNGVENSKSENFKKVLNKQIFRQLEDLAKQEFYYKEQRDVELPL